MHQGKVEMHTSSLVTNIERLQAPLHLPAGEANTAQPGLLELILPSDGLDHPGADITNGLASLSNFERLLNLGQSLLAAPPSEFSSPRSANQGEELRQ